MRVYPHHERCPPAVLLTPVFGCRVVDSDSQDELRGTVHEGRSVMWAREHGAEYEPGEWELEPCDAPEGGEDW